MEREILIKAAQASNEVIFVGSDGTLSSIAPVHTRWDKLKIDGFVPHEVLEDGGAFIVKTLELGAEPNLDKHGDRLLVSC